MRTTHIPICIDMWAWPEDSFETLWNTRINNWSIKYNPGVTYNSPHHDTVLKKTMSNKKAEYLSQSYMLLVFRRCVWEQE